MAAGRLQGDAFILDSGPGAGVAQQAFQLADIVAMDQFVDTHTLEFLGIASGKDLGRAGGEGDFAGRVKLKQQIRTAEGERDETVTLDPQVFGAGAFSRRKDQFVRRPTQNQILHGRQARIAPSRSRLNFWTCPVNEGLLARSYRSGLKPRISADLR